MRRVIGIAVLFCIIGLLVAPTSAKETTVKLGGGAFFGEETIFGGAAAVDVPTSFLEGMLHVSPFVDAFISKKWYKAAGGGINIILKKEANEKAKVYGGVGGGIGHTRYRGTKKTHGLVDVVGGVEFQATSQISIFAQGKFMAFLASEESVRVTVGGVTRTVKYPMGPRKAAVEVGVAFNVGQ